MIDAPVSGGTAGAQAGTLTFIVGGEEDALERARPVLQAMGKNIFHVGASGAGQVAKLCNNMALGVIMAVTGEAIALGVAHGLDPKVLSQMMAVSTGRSWATEVCNPWPGVLRSRSARVKRSKASGFRSSGRPGPVAVYMPLDVQNTEIDVEIGDDVIRRVQMMPPAPHPDGSPSRR